MIQLYSGFIIVGVFLALASAADTAPIVKMVLLGPSGVGKSSLMYRWTYNRPPSSAQMMATVGGMAQ